jgi:hypothetical protein
MEVSNGYRCHSALSKQAIMTAFGCFTDIGRILVVGVIKT